MTSPTVTNMPDVPVRGEDYSVFQPEAVAWVKALNTLRLDLNTFGAHFETWQQTLEGYKSNAEQAVSNAQVSELSTNNSAQSASAEVTRASDAADNAEQSELGAKASSILAVSNAGIPSLTGNADKLLLVDTDELGVSLDSVDQFVVGDISRAPEGVLSIPEWLLCDGSVFDSVTYPDLYSVLGTTTLPNISGTDDFNYYIKTGL